MDLATILGISVALVMILGGNLIEGGKISQIAQPTAAMIVIGGTIGATMIQFPMTTLKRAAASVVSIFKEPPNLAAKLIDEIVQYATTARKEGIVALENVMGNVSDPFLARALTMAVDGSDSTAMREALERSIGQIEEEGEDVAKVFEAAGGYSPTIGIIGAVLGLIQVMSHLSDIEKVGEGIATAFVATIYGVAFANILCLPVGGKLKQRNREAVALKLMMLEGALAIQEGMNPKLVRERLLSLHSSPEHSGKKDEKASPDAVKAAA